MDIPSVNKISDIQFLKLCSSITKGNTIYLGNLTLVPIDSWWHLIRRRWNSEDRYVVLRYIDLKISKILADLYSEIKNVDLDELISAINGLRQLSLTYENDEKFKLELSIIINKMEYSIKAENEKNNSISDPKFIPTLTSESITKEDCNRNSIPESPFTNTLKKIRTWSEFCKRSPPQFNSSLLGFNKIKSPSYDSLDILS